MTATSLDQTKADTFGDHIVDILNHAATALMISVGHRTGLFDTMANLPPSTSADVASAAGLHERYVREWLGAMTVSRIVECDPERNTYYFPPEHAACLTRAASPNNIASFTQYIAVMGQVEDKIVHCFKHGGGVPYSDYPRFHAVMAEDSAQTVASSLTSEILPLVPGIHERLEQGIDVLDLGCGSGKAANLMALAYPNSRITGYDFSAEAIANAQAEAQSHGLTNVRFEVRDVTNLEGQQYDLICAFDAIHDQAHPDKVLSTIHRALKDDGAFLMQDIAGSSHHHKNLDHPVGPLLYMLSCMHCMTVSLAQGGMGLGAMWGEEKAREMLAEAGFGSVETRKLDHDFQNNYYIVTK